MDADDLLGPRAEIRKRQLSLKAFTEVMNGPDDLSHQGRIKERLEEAEPAAFRPAMRRNFDLD